jgi:PAS domain S-box-containing protein
MKKKPHTPLDAAELRRRAELRLRADKPKGAPVAEADTQRLVHELQVHQIELEMQNDELRQSRFEVEAGLARYTDLYDFAPVGYLTLGRDGVIRQANLTGARLLGVERGRLLGRRFGLFVGAPDRAGFNTFLENVFAGQAACVCEVALPRDGQGTLFVLITATLSPDDQECGAMVMDITERKLAEEELRKSEERYRDLATAHTGMVWETDESFIVTHLSGRVRDTLGYEPEEIIGLSPLFLIDPDERERVGTIMARLPQKHEPVKDIEFWSRHKDGRRVRILTNGIAFFASDGRFLGCRGTHLDVTEAYWARRRRDLILYIHEMSSGSDAAISAVLCEACAEFTDSPMAFFGMVEPDESAMIAHVWSPMAMAECRIPDKPLRYPIEKAGLWAEPIRRREPTIFNDYPASQAKRGLPDGHVPITRYLGVPIIAGDKAIAVAGVANRATNYDDRHIVRLRSITSTITDFLSVRRQEQALRESDQLLRTFIDFTADWEYWLMPDGRHQYDSPSCREISGYSPKEFHDDPDLIARIVHPEDRQAYAAHTCAVRADAEIEFRIIHKDGDTRWIQHRCRPILKDDGTYVGVRVSNRDITKSKQAGEALRESEEKFRLLHEAAGVGIGYYTPDGIVISFNSAAAQYMGGTPEEFIGKSIHELFPPDQAKLYLSRLQKAAASSHWQKYEDCTDLPTGVMWFQSVFTRVINSNRQIVGVQIVSIDITDTKRVEEEIHRNSKRLKAMVEILQHRPENRQMFLDHALDKAMELTGSRFGYIYFYDEDREEFELNSWSKAVMSDCLVANPQTTYHLEKTGAWGEAVRQGKPLIINNFQEDNPLKKGYPTGHVGLTRFLTIPVFHAGRIVAVVGLANKASDYSETDTLELTLLMDSVWKTVENMKNEEALRESEMFLQETQQVARLGGWKANPTTDELKWTDGVYDIIGVSRDYRPGLDEGLKYYCPEYIPSIQEGLTRCLNEGKPFTMEAEIITEKGNRRWVELRGFLGQDNSAEPVVMGTIQNITERKLAEEQLRLMAEMIDTAPNAIIVHDFDGAFLYANRKSFELHGYDGIEFMKLNLRDLDTPESEALIEERMRIIAAKGEASFTVRHRRKDGKILPMEVFVKTVDWDGRPAMLSIAVDISDRIRAEEERSKLEAQLQQATKMEAVGTLAGGIAHDFNNLLQGIGGYTQFLLMDKKPDDTEYPILKAIQDAGFRAADLVKQLLLFSRKADSTKKSIELQHEVEHAKKLLERTIPKMVEIEVRTGARLWTINADPVQMEQMLLNLGTNAADAMPDGGKLLFEIENTTLDDNYANRHLGAQPGRYVLLTVSDTGEGMDQETMENIFDPFFTTKEFGKGTGLGLASVFGIVKSHGGYITCYSELGQGTTFRIYFPALEQPEVEGTDEVEAKPIPRGTETILLVDDEETIRDFAQLALFKFGYQVMTASTGEEALKIYSAAPEKIDIIVMDLGMPGMGGHKCLQELFRIDPAVKVVIASGYPVNGQVKQSLEAGSKGYVGKPYQLADLLNTVRAVLDDQAS